jgi:hypothetical protein
VSYSLANGGANQDRRIPDSDDALREAVEPGERRDPVKWSSGERTADGDGSLLNCPAEEGRSMNTNLADYCRNHSWRRATTRRLCRLCLQHVEMRARWKKIRQALRIVSRYSPRPAVKVKAQPPMGILRASASALTPGAELDHKLLVINYGQLILQVVPQDSR